MCPHQMFAQLQNKEKPQTSAKFRTVNAGDGARTRK